MPGLMGRMPLALLVVAAGLLSWTGADSPARASEPTPQEYLDPVKESPMQTLRRVTREYSTPDPERTATWTKREFPDSPLLLLLALWRDCVFAGKWDAAVKKSEDPLLTDHLRKW